MTKNNDLARLDDLLDELNERYAEISNQELHELVTSIKSTGLGGHLETFVVPDMEEIAAQRGRNNLILSEIARSSDDPHMRAAFQSFAARAAHPRGWGTAYDQLGLYRITDAETANSRMGSCDMAGKLQEGDLALCVRHSGDYFHTFILLDEVDGYVSVRPNGDFSGYGGMGDKVGQLTEVEYLSLTEFAVSPRPTLENGPA